MIMEGPPPFGNTPPPHGPPPYHDMYWHYRGPPPGPPPPPPHTRGPYTPPDYRRPYPEEERLQQQELNHSNSWNSAGGESYRREDRQKRLLRHRQQQLHRQNMLRPRMDGHSPSSAGYYEAPYENPYYRWEEQHDENRIHSPRTENLRAESFDESLYSPVPYEQIHPTSSQGEYYPEPPPEEEGINVISPNRQSPGAFDFKRYPPSSPLRAVPIDSFDSYHDEHAFLPPPSSCRPLTEKKHITPDKTKLAPSSSHLPVPPSKTPVALDMSHVNNNDVLCGRGGGTNSQVGNRRFRQLVQDHQPQYLTARRKEKPMIARKIVRMIRQRGGRFLKRDDNTEHLFEVGDDRAEAKTSQALREGLDVRATKGGAQLLSKKKEGVPVSRSCSFATPDRSQISISEKRKASEISVQELNEDERKLFLDFSPPRSSKISKLEHKTITPCRSYDSKSEVEEEEDKKEPGAESL